MQRVLSALVVMSGVIAFLLSPQAGMAGAPIPEATGAGVTTLAPMLRQITPGVVNIAVKGKVREQNPLMQDPFFRRFLEPGDRTRERQTQATGSGVIVDATHGYVLTNAHVVENAVQIEVTMKDNRRLSAKLIGRDAETDVAVLQVPPENLTAVPLGNSDALQVGDFVLAIGNPFGLGQTVTSGIVSALGRSLGIEGYEDFIQTDASINPGNSGGALVNLRGELVGINTAILAPGGGNIGIGFAVPINVARAVMEQILAHGEVQRGWLGVQIQDLTPELAKAMHISRSEGAVVKQVEPDSPAKQAGIQPGDLIVAVDGKAIRSSGDLRNRIALTPVGRTVTLTVIRDGATKTIDVRIEKSRKAAALPGTPGIDRPA